MLFTDDAFIDYSVFGGSVGDLDTTIDFLTKALTDDLFPNTQHLVANLQVKVEGDAGRGRVQDEQVAAAGWTPRAAEGGRRQGGRRDRGDPG